MLVLGAQCQLGFCLALRMRKHRIMRCAGDELTDRPACACWPGVRRAGLPRQSPARRRAAAERSGAALITAAEVSSWVGSLVARGLAPSTATRALATLRSVLAFAVADARVQHNVAAAVRNPTSGRARREGQALTLTEVASLTEACQGRYSDVVPVMALAGLRWGELAGLQVGDRISVPGPGLRLRRAVLASEGGGALYGTR